MTEKLTWINIQGMYAIQAMQLPKMYQEIADDGEDMEAHSVVLVYGLVGKPNFDFRIVRFFFYTFVSAFDAQRQPSDDQIKFNGLIVGGTFLQDPWMADTDQLFQKNKMKRTNIKSY